MPKPQGVIAQWPTLAATPTGNPPAGHVLVYYKSTDGKLYTKSSAGVETAVDLGTGSPTGTAGGDLTGTYPNPTIASGAVTDAKVAAANKDGAVGTASMRTLGTGAQQAAAGNDARLSDARTPLAHTHTLIDLPGAWLKMAVRVATTANITLSAPQTVDGVAVVAGDRVLVKNQTTTSQNGIYQVNAGAWTRTAGADVTSDIAGGTVSIDQGAQGGQIWSTSFKSTDTLGTTAMFWYRVLDTSLAGVAGGYENFIAAGTTSQYRRGDKTWQTLDKSAVGLANVDNTADSAKPVSTAQQTALNLKADLASPALTGAATLDGQALVKTNDSRLSDARTPTTHTHTLIDLPGAWLKMAVRVATTANITLSAPQTIDGIAVVAGDRVLVKNQTTTSQNGIYQVNAGAWTRTAGADVTSDIAGGTVSVDQGSQGGQVWSTSFKSTDTLGTTAMFWYRVLDTSLAGVAGGYENFIAAGTTSQYRRGDKTWQTLDKSAVGLANVDNTADSAKPVSTAQQTALNLKANLASPAFTGTPTGITKAHVGLANVDNTADSAKPVSTAQQTALNLKANLASPAFTGTPTGITKTHVGLANVDNTADSAKPVSTAQQTALNGKANTSHTHVATTDLTATGTKNSSTFLRGDNTWATPIVENTLICQLSAYHSTSQTLIAGDAWKLISNWTTDYTPIGITSAGAGSSFTITQGGRYAINFSIGYAIGGIPGSYGATIWVDGVRVATTLSHCGVAANLSASVSRVVALTAGQVVTFRGLVGAPTALNTIIVDGYSYCSFVQIV